MTNYARSFSIARILSQLCSKMSDYATFYAFNAIVLIAKWTSFTYTCVCLKTNLAGKQSRVMLETVKEYEGLHVHV